MGSARMAGRWVLAVGLVVVLGRWSVHWGSHPVLAVLSGVGIAALAVSVWTARHVAAFRIAAGVCLVDALIVARAWSAHLPAHCGCVRRAGAPALAGWGGAIILADLVLVGVAVWLSRSLRRAAPRP